MFKTILVTGGCGFIGSNFIKGFMSRHQNTHIINLDALTYAGNPQNLKQIEHNSNYTFIKGQCQNQEVVESLFKTYSIDAVINFAAESHVDRSIENDTPFIQTNIIGTQVLLQVARKNKIKRFIQVSTDEVYGSLSDKGFFIEDTPLMPNSPYSASKASADLLVRAYIETYNFPGIITRCSNNYGPYQFPEKLIPLMIQKALDHKDLPVYGNGLNIRDWIYVDDHCLGIESALINGENGEIYNFGSNEEHRNIDIVTKLIQKLGSKSEIKFVNDRLGHDYRYAIDSSKTKRTLNWSPLTSFEEGLEKTISWYKNNSNWLESIQNKTYQNNI